MVKPFLQLSLWRWKRSTHWGWWQPDSLQNRAALLPALLKCTNAWTGPLRLAADGSDPHGWHGFWQL